MRVNELLMSGRGRSELGEIDGCEAGDDCRAGIFQIFLVGEKLACDAGIVRVKARWGRCNRWEKYTIYFCLKKEANGYICIGRAEFG